MSSERQVDLDLTLDWDWGVDFTFAEPPTSVDDVLPGNTCDIESALPRRVVIHEVEVGSGFSLVQISVGGREVKWHLAHYLSESPESATSIESVEWAGGENRRYRLEPPLTVQADEHIRARLKNDDDESRKPKVAMFVNARSARQHGIGPQ